jgi:transcription-repair coupling factor (superfamily II helicase)
MGQFLDRRADLLLCTHIIESGFYAIPHANTIIIHRADRFGLSQLLPAARAGWAGQGAQGAMPI